LPRAASVVAVVAMLVLAAVAFYAVGRDASSGSPTRTVFVTGSGTATSVPDTVTFQLGVTTLRANAAEALHVNNLRMHALEKALQAQGVKKKDLQTSGLSIYQTTNQNGTPTGFSVSDTLQVVMHNFQRAGGAIDAAVTAVGNGVSFNGVSFSQSNQSTALTQARANAIDAAHRAASTLARAAHLTLGAPIKIVDQENQSPPTPYPLGFATATGSAAMKSAFSTPLSPGTMTVSVQVSVTYQVTP
jgi:hypothetical protein